MGLLISRRVRHTLHKRRSLAELVQAGPEVYLSSIICFVGNCIARGKRGDTREVRGERPSKAGGREATETQKPRIGNPKTKTFRFSSHNDYSAAGRWRKQNAEGKGTGVRSAPRFHLAHACKGRGIRVCWFAVNKWAALIQPAARASTLRKLQDVSGKGFTPMR